MSANRAFLFRTFVCLWTILQPYLRLLPIMVVLKYALLCIVIPFVTLLLFTLAIMIYRSATRQAKSGLVRPTTPSVVCPVVQDPFLHRTIAIGDTVVVVQSHFTSPSDYLQNGDLLKLTNVQLDGHLVTRKFGKDDKEFANLWCSGVLLPHYLDYDACTQQLNRRPRDSLRIIERQFPLRIVSLERTLQIGQH